MPVIEQIGKLRTELAELRRDIHAHPEAAFEEVRPRAIGLRAGPMIASPDMFEILVRGRGGRAGDIRNVIPGEGGCMLHSPRYDFNDDILALGASYWSRLAEHVLAK